jgi:DNA-binding NarL/FixJ family response regulator
VNTVAVCDTEPVAIEGVRSLLESAEGLRVVAVENSVVDGVEAVRALQPSILLVEKAFGIRAVMDWLKEIRQSSPGTAVIVWSCAFTEVESLRFLQAGAAGVLRKTAPLEILLRCIRTVVSGGTWMEHDWRADPLGQARPAHSPLTARELQVMELVERGLKNKDIGAALGIRTGTVKIHLKHIFEKTGIRGRYGLALSGLREKGLLAIA